MSEPILLSSGKTVIKHDVFFYGRNQRRSDMERVLWRFETHDEKLRRLPQREREIYDARAEGTTFVKIGQDLHLTAYRAHQLYEQALRRLSPPLNGEERGAAILTLMLQSIRDDLTPSDGVGHNTPSR